MRARAHGWTVAAVLALAGCLGAPPVGGDDPGVDPDANGNPNGAARRWVERSVDVTPPRLFGPRLTYDSERGVVLLYGGSISIDNAAATASLLSWDGATWTTLCDDCAPGPRLFHGFAFDGARGRAVLYGGLDDSGQRHGEIWEWDGNAWTEIAGEGPPARSHVWMSYDPERQKMVVFGGETEFGLTNELLEYDGDLWVLTGPGEPPPPRRDAGGNAAAFDPIGKRVLFYGDDAMGDDLWAWDGTDWSRLCADCTGVPRSGAMLEVDASRQRIVIVGGWRSDVSVVGTWELDGGGAQVCEMREPTQRDTGAIVRNRDRDLIVLYGGNGTGCGGNCDQTLELVFSELGECAP